MSTTVIDYTRMSGATLAEIMATNSSRTNAHKAAKAEVNRRVEKRELAASLAETAEVEADLAAAGITVEDLDEAEVTVTREDQLKVIRRWATEDAAAFAAEHAEPGDFVRTKITKRAEFLAAYIQASEDAGELLPA